MKRITLAIALLAACSPSTVAGVDQPPPDLAAPPASPADLAEPPRPYRLEVRKDPGSPLDPREISVLWDTKLQVPCMRQPVGQLAAKTERCVPYGAWRGGYVVPSIFWIFPSNGADRDSFWMDKECTLERITGIRKGSESPDEPVRYAYIFDESYQMMGAVYEVRQIKMPEPLFKRSTITNTCAPIDLREYEEIRGTTLLYAPTRTLNIDELATLGDIADAVARAKGK